MFLQAQSMPFPAAGSVLLCRRAQRTTRVAALAGRRWCSGVGVKHLPRMTVSATSAAGGSRMESEPGPETKLEKLTVGSLVDAGNCNPLPSTVGKLSNIFWHNCPVGHNEREKLLGHKGCVLWITGLSGSGKSTLACALSQELHSRGHLTYILDGDNLRLGLNKDLSFKPDDRAENIRRVGEVAKLFADAGLICITSLISPYKRDRDACRHLMPASSFIEVFMNVPLEVCEERDPKGLYKLARAGKIKGFTGVDDPYEPPSSCEIVIGSKDGICPSPKVMADEVICYLKGNGYLNE